MRITRHYVAGLFTILVCATNAQEDNASKFRGYMAFSGGISLPEDEFGSNNNTAPGGYAALGGSFSFSMGLTPAHIPIGFALMGGYYVNKYQFNDFLNDRQAADPNSMYGSNEQNADALFYAGFYGMVGLCKEITLNKVAFDFRALIGSLSVSTPEINYYASYQGPLLSSYTTTWDISNAKGSAFCYDFGATARVKRVDNVNVFVNVDFIRSQVPYSTHVIYTDKNGNTSNYMNSNNLVVSSISFSIGIGYDIGN